MVYYTLGKQGHAWLEDEAPPPHKYSKVLAALAELIQDNDVPRTASQLTHILSSSESEVEKGLKYLEREEYVEEAVPPTPKTGARLRIPSIEKLAESEARRQLAQERYFHSDKGQEALRRYWNGKGKQVRGKYWKGDKGKLAQKIWRLKRRVFELEAFVGKGGDGGAKEKLEDAKNRLNEALKEREHAVSE